MKTETKIIIVGSVALVVAFIAYEFVESVETETEALGLGGIAGALTWLTIV